MQLDINWLQAELNTGPLAPMAQGGQKVVLKTTTGPPMVVKVVHPTADPERVIREIQAAHRLAGHFVPQVHWARQIPSPLGTLIVFAEQLIPGATLRSLVASGTAATDALHLTRRLTAIAAAAEAAHIVHRDIKPDNIIVNPGSGAWLLDFGLARVLDKQSLTATGNAYGPGTPGYNPPEQFRNHKRIVDARCDLFAIGVTLYEYVTGMNPYTNGTRDVLERLHRIESMELPRLSPQQLASAGLADLIHALTRRARHQRPRTAALASAWAQSIV